MEKCNSFFNMYENQAADRFRNGKLVKMLGGIRVQIQGKTFHFNTNFQRAISKENRNILNLFDADILTVNKNLKSCNYDTYRPQGGETKSKRFKYNKDILPHSIVEIQNSKGERIDELQGEVVKIISPHYY